VPLVTLPAVPAAHKLALGALVTNAVLCAMPHSPLTKAAKLAVTLTGDTTPVSVQLAPEHPPLNPVKV
jgi:hypothetical protein